MRTIPLLVALAILLLCTASVHAQARPFFNGGATAFDPEISVVNSGAILDAQAVVSPDRKYVTLNMRPTNASLLALRAFTFQNGNQGNPGFVGLGPIVNPADAGPAGAPHGSATPPAAPPKAPAPPAHPTVLHRSGMTRLELRRG